MVKLIEDIKVFDYLSCSNAGQPRLWINTGTVLARKISRSLNYSPDAFIPLESWRELELEEQQLVLSPRKTKHLDLSNRIGIIKIPESVLTPLENLGVSFISSPRECQFLSQQPIYRQALQILVEYLQSLSRPGTDIKVHNIATNAPGLRTVTCDRIRQCYIGLHLDSWDKFSLERRHLSSNRICINLGLEMRYFLFVNLTLLEMFALASRAEQEESLPWRESQTLAQIAPTSIRQKFFEKYPTYPVIKIGISPGEAYIAPTENMIHDASTFEKKFQDVLLTIRGYINLP